MVRWPSSAEPSTDALGFGEGRRDASVDTAAGFLFAAAARRSESPRLLQLPQAGGSPPGVFAVARTFVYHSGRAASWGNADRGGPGCGFRRWCMPQHPRLGGDEVGRPWGPAGRALRGAP